jgi:cell division protein FtsB
MSKRILLRIFLAGEIVFFVTMYVTSPEGLASIENKKIENKQLASHIKTLTKEINKLEDEINDWENNSFYREKVAREQLQMARPTDEVYYV